MQKRNYVIDLLRFLFCTMIVFHHSFVMYGGYVFAPTGYMGVEFFFIVTGFYMMSKVEQIDGEIIDIGIATKQYIIPKVKKIFPVLLVSIIASIILQYVSGVNTDILNNSINSIPELLMLQMYGIGSSYPTGVAWYLSAMFMVLIVIYPICLRFKSLYANVIAPVGSVILIGYIMRCTGNIGSDPGIYLGVMPKGVWRAFAEISMGVILYGIVNKISQRELSKCMKILLGLLEVAGYLSIAYIAYKYTAGQTDLYILLILLISMAITLSGKSIVYDLFNWRIWKYFGRFSMVWFLNNYYVARCVPSLFSGYSGKKLLYIYVAFSFVMALIVYVVVEMIKYLSRNIKLKDERKSGYEESECANSLL